ncbi:RNA polymerase sigma-70 factor (ECF subfamily) [Hydrogenophaga palleronii]|uniref:RNA polymerase sigma-70 factor (ECF subfamily) n=1 Tax=Hydrogenophaga palleronii TaxID=65655 RepID=A0ABU1WTQ8_9BURK|nr:sigma-70 family RNA polymerase sigma factor [Hydrogenophaga palleronii]MDR7152691.1 RNA polymerase sigma-70 factor (ECF subfamily) [Hydrogenophaga palleronii]
MTIDPERLQRSQERERELKAMMVAALDGDEAAYRQCLQGLSKHLRAFLSRRLTRDAAEVEDLVQETLLAIHCQRHTFAADRPLTAWVQAIASYKLADWFRGHGGRLGRLDPLDDHENLFADDHGLAGEATRDVRQLLQDLPQRWRVPIELTKLGGYSVNEAALASGMSASAIKVGVHRGMKALAQLARKQI